MALAGKKPAADRPVIASCLIVDGRTTDPYADIDSAQSRRSPAAKLTFNSVVQWPAMYRARPSRPAYRLVAATVHPRACAAPGKLAPAAARREARAIGSPRGNPHTGQRRPRGNAPPPCLAVSPIASPGDDLTLAALNLLSVGCCSGVLECSWPWVPTSILAVVASMGLRSEGLDDRSILSERPSSSRAGGDRRTRWPFDGAGMYGVVSRTSSGAFASIAVSHSVARWGPHAVAVDDDSRPSLASRAGSGVVNSVRRRGVGVRGTPPCGEVRPREGERDRCRSGGGRGHAPRLASEVPGMDDPTARDRRDLRLLGAIPRHDDAGHGSEGDHPSALLAARHHLPVAAEPQQVSRPHRSPVLAQSSHRRRPLTRSPATPVLGVPSANRTCDPVLRWDVLYARSYRRRAAEGADRPASRNVAGPSKRWSASRSSYNCRGTPAGRV